MKAVFLSFLLLPFTVAVAEETCPWPLLDHELKVLGEDRQVNLCDEYAGKVILMVNTASKCGYTPQYEGLENLYATYEEKGLVVLGFPSNDFGGQEPGTENEIQEFCRSTYSIKFPMFAKQGAKEATASPLYQSLGSAAGEYPAWNFHKYVINQKGEIAASLKSSVKPESKEMIELIESLL